MITSKRIEDFEPRKAPNTRKKCEDGKRGIGAGNGKLDVPDSVHGLRDPGNLVPYGGFRVIRLSPGTKAMFEIQNPRRDGEIPVAQLVSVLFCSEGNGDAISIREDPVGAAGK